MLAVVVWRIGTGPFVGGLEAVDGRALLAAVAIGFVTTVCGAWRWTVVARGLGVQLSLPAAVAAYYRALFLNVTLPSGVAGDVHRGVSHGREVRRRRPRRAGRRLGARRRPGRADRADLSSSWSSPRRCARPCRSSRPRWSAVALALVLVGRLRAGGGRSRWMRVRNAVVADIRNGVLRRNASPAIVLASTVAVLGYAVMFLVAARTAGVDSPVSRLLPLAMLAVLAMVLPSIAGWGPSEGATAWVFSAAGLGAARGAATAVAYGVLVLAAFLPGAVVLVAGGFPPRLSPPRRAGGRLQPEGAADA